MLVAAAAPASGQTGGLIVPASPAQPESFSTIEFSADQVTYDSDADMVTATGAVRASVDAVSLGSLSLIARSFNRVSAPGAHCRAGISATPRP